MLDQPAANAAFSGHLERLHARISEVLAEADQLELRMVGIHLCNALHSLDEDMAQDRS